ISCSSRTKSSSGALPKNPYRRASIGVPFAPLLASMQGRDALDAVRQAAQSFSIPALLDLIGDARLVLIAEATHPTPPFYSIRAALTKALIQSKQFNLVTAEADWPDAYRVNRWVRHMSHEPDAAAALGDFVRFPRWMWRNTVVVDFVDWLRQYNGKKRMTSDR